MMETAGRTLVRARYFRAVLALAMSFSLLVGMAEAADDTERVQGAPLYRVYCIFCHGARGEGYRADNAVAIGGQDFLVSVSDEFLKRSISNGRPSTPMAAYAKRHGGPLSDPDIDALVAFIRGWQSEADADIRPAPIIGDAVTAQGEFNAYCAECHGMQGQGVTAVSLNNPEFLAAASDEQIRWAIVNGRRGTPMSSFGEKLSSKTIDDLVALIRSWQHEAPKRIAETELSGAPSIVLNPGAPTPRFLLREGRYVSAEQLDAAMRTDARLVILDARPTSDWKLHHIPGAVSAPYYDAESVVDRLPRDGTWIVSYCACPHKLSDQLTDALRRAGFRNTAVLNEGVLWWEQNGYPIERAGE